MADENWKKDYDPKTKSYSKEHNERKYHEQYTRDATAAATDQRAAAEYAQIQRKLRMEGRLRPAMGPAGPANQGRPMGQEQKDAGIARMDAPYQQNLNLGTAYNERDPKDQQANQMMDIAQLGMGVPGMVETGIALVRAAPHIAQILAKSGFAQTAMSLMREARMAGARLRAGRGQAGGPMPQGAPQAGGAQGINAGAQGAQSGRTMERMAPPPMRGPNAANAGKPPQMRPKASVKSTTVAKRPNRHYPEPEPARPMNAGSDMSRIAKRTSSKRTVGSAQSSGKTAEVKKRAAPVTSLGTRVGSRPGRVRGAASRPSKASDETKLVSRGDAPAKAPKQASAPRTRRAPKKAEASPAPTPPKKAAKSKDNPPTPSAKSSSKRRKAAIAAGAGVVAGAARLKRDLAEPIATLGKKATGVAKDRSLDAATSKAKDATKQKESTEDVGTKKKKSAPSPAPRRMTSSSRTSSGKKKQKR